MRLLSSAWTNAYFLFDPIQYFFNGNFWVAFKKRFGKHGRGRVLDLACGTGELIKYINPRSYVGLDINSTYINFARKRFVKNKVTGFIVSDITKTAPEDNFDVAFLISAAHHLSNAKLKMVIANLKKAQVKTVIVIDGYPIGFFSRFLSFLDSFLAGGKYFRDHKEIEEVIKGNFKVVESGEFGAKGSFYRYPFVILKL